MSDTLGALATAHRVGTASGWICDPAASACLATVAIEVFAATEALGPAYEQLDILAVERADS